MALLQISYCNKLCSKLLVLATQLSIGFSHSCRPGNSTTSRSQQVVGPRTCLPAAAVYPLWAFSVPLPSVLDIGSYLCLLLRSFHWLLRKSHQISSSFSFATWRIQAFLWPLPAGLSCGLRAPERTHYKLAILVYRVLRGDAPRYLGPLTRVDDLPGRRTLRPVLPMPTASWYRPSNCQQSAAEPLRLRLHTSGIHCQLTSLRQAHCPPSVDCWNVSYSNNHILTVTSSTDIIQLVVLAVVAPLRPL